MIAAAEPVPRDCAMPAGVTFFNRSLAARYHSLIARMCAPTDRCWGLLHLRPSSALPDDSLAGLEYLDRGKLRCTLCDVKCTSWETLETHGRGAKHVRRARAAAR